MQYWASFCRRGMSCQGWTCLGELWRVLKLWRITGRVGHTRSTLEQWSVLYERSFFQCWKVEWSSGVWGLQLRWDNSPHFSVWLMWRAVGANTLCSQVALLRPHRRSWSKAYRSWRWYVADWFHRVQHWYLATSLLIIWLGTGCSALWTALCGSHPRYCNSVSLLSSA